LARVGFAKIGKEREKEVSLQKFGCVEVLNIAFEK
jgi:hypothetical protein